MKSLMCRWSVALALIGAVAAPCAAAAAPPTATVLEVRWSVKVPAPLSTTLGDDERGKWEQEQSEKLAALFTERKQAYYFAFWSFVKPQDNKKPALVIRVWPGEDPLAPQLLYAVEIENLHPTPVTLRDGVLYDGQLYKDFSNGNKDESLNSLAVKVRDLLTLKEKNQFREQLANYVWIADGLGPLVPPDGPSGVLPFPFAGGVADCFESKFEILFRVGKNDAAYEGTGKGQHGNQLRIDYAAPHGPDKAVSVKVTKIVSRSQAGRPPVLVPADRVPSDLPPQK